MLNINFVRSVSNGFFNHAWKRIGYGNDRYGLDRFWRGGGLLLADLGSERNFGQLSAGRFTFIFQYLGMQFLLWLKEAAFFYRFSISHYCILGHG